MAIAQAGRGYEVMSAKEAQKKLEADKNQAIVAVLERLKAEQTRTIIALQLRGAEHATVEAIPPEAVDVEIAKYSSNQPTKHQ